MKIFIKYFGLIKDITHLKEEVFEIKNNMSVLQFIEENLYSDESHKIITKNQITIPKKELFIGIKCTYAVKYLKETNFYKSKCKISEELSKVFEKMGLVEQFGFNSKNLI